MIHRRSTLLLSVHLARWREAVGAWGLAGLALCAASALWTALAWREHRHALPLQPMEAVQAPKTPTAPASPSPMPSLRSLPPSDELPLLLTQVQRIAIDQGLPWQAAEYKAIAASAELPPAFEIRCALKGPYPALRAALVRMLAEVPGLALRALAFERTSTDSAEVTAKLTVVLFMRPSAVISGSQP